MGASLLALALALAVYCLVSGYGAAWLLRSEWFTALLRERQETSVQAYQAYVIESGMSVRQVIRMVAGEALTYTAFGVLLGCAAGLPLNRMLFMALVTSRWGEAWSLPVWEMLVIVMIMIGSVCAAVAGPAGQIRKMTVVDTIGV